MITTREKNIGNNAEQLCGFTQIKSIFIAVKIWGKPMQNVSEGIRRLSILLGGFGSLFWLMFTLSDWDDFMAFATRNPTSAWPIFIGGLLVCFLIPYFLTRLIYWVYRGFKQ